MSKPVVAIVGRPNVGKSTLFNVLAGDKISIVKDTPGVTRDRIYADVSWLDNDFTIIDTGGIEPDSGDVILSQMREQAQIAIDTADVIIFITDVHQGLVDSDAKVADMLRRSGKPVVLAVNKVDSIQKYMMDVYEFYNLGIGEPFAISAANRQGLGDMLDEVVKHFPEDAGEDEDSDIPKIAIVGKPNVGKSSLLNALLEEDKAIVTNIAGTTRDLVEGSVKVGNVTLNLIDTAGIHESEDTIEKIGIEKSREALEKAELVLLVLDSTQDLSKEDKELLELTKDRDRIIIYNKNDEKQIDDVVSISAKNREIDALIQTIEKKYEKEIHSAESDTLNNERQIGLARSARNSMQHAIDALEMGCELDLVTIDLQEAYYALKEITGKTCREDLLDEIFSRFCLGK